MSTRSIIIIILTAAWLVGVSFYLSPTSPQAQAASNDWLLSWSSDSYVPPGYPGRALPSRGGTVKIVVSPTKSPSPNLNLVYFRWLLDGSLASRSSGQGKSSFDFRVTKWGGDNHEVELQILDGQENIVWRGTLNVRVASPQLFFKIPTNDYALTDSLTASPNQEMVLTAQPFFFQVNELSSLLFDWSIDGQTLTATGAKNPDQLIVKIPQGKLAEVIFKNLSLLVKNKTDQAQQSKADLLIEIK